MIFEANRKKVVLGILLLVIVVLALGSFDYFTFIPDLVFDHDLYAIVELERVPSWQRDYRLSKEENSRILNILKNVKLSSIATSDFKYQSSDKVYSIHLNNELNNRPEYSVLISENQSLGRIFKTDAPKPYIFEIANKDMIYINQLFEKYHDLAFENDINKNISYELKM